MSGGVFTVYGMPGSLSGSDAGLPVNMLQQSTSGGVRTKLTAIAGQAPYEWKVWDNSHPESFSKPPIWDSGSVAASNDNCVVTAGEASCTVPVGVLKVGGTYSVQTTYTKSGKPQNEKRMFTVQDQEAISGSTTVQIPARKIRTGFGEYGLGMHFSTANQGVTPTSGTVDGMTQGLPPGWSWDGIGDGVSAVRVASLGTGGYQGYDSTLTLLRGMNSTLLGCTTNDDQSKTCQQLNGGQAGNSYSAVIPANGSESVAVTDQGSGIIYDFDQQGKLVKRTAPGTYPMNINYTDTGRFDKVSYGELEWDFHYAGSSECKGDLAPGFVEAPEGYVCAIDQPSGDWAEILYSKPAGAENPRLSRFMHISADCKGNYNNCAVLDVETTDFGWDAQNRPVATRTDAYSWAVAAGSMTTGYDVTESPSLEQVKADQSLMTIEYDDFGRGLKVVNPAHSNGESRQVTARVYSEYGAVSKKYGNRFNGGTRAVELTTTSSDGALAPTSMVRVYDDFLRGLYQTDPTGTVQETVWTPFSTSGPLATITNNEYIQASIFDARGREVASYSGLTDNFDMKDCSASAAAKVRTPTVCAPNDKKETVQQAISYDQVSDGSGTAGNINNGLIQQWFKADDFGDEVDQPTVANWQTAAGQSPGFSLARPQGVGNSFATRLGGSITLPQADVDIAISVADPHLQGQIVIDNVYCNLANQSASCEWNNSPGAVAAGGLDISTSSPVQFYAALFRSSDEPYVDGPLSIQITNIDTGKRITLDNSNFRQRYSKVTAMAAIDPVTSGSATAYTATTVSVYDDPRVSDPTGTRIVGDSPDYPGQENLGMTRTDYEINEFGSSRVKQMMSPAGDQVTGTVYWSDTDTAAKSNLPNLGQVPSSLRDVPQRGQAKTIIATDGVRKNLIYDQFGTLACHQEQTNESDSDAQWTCTERDGMYRLVKETYRSNDTDIPEIVNEYEYALTSTPGAVAMNSTVSTATGQKGDAYENQTQLVGLSAAKQVVTYQDALGTQTATDYDAYGRTSEQTVDISKALNGQYQPYKSTYAYNAMNLLDSVSVQGNQMAKVQYYGAGQAQMPGAVNSVSYPSFPGVSMKMNYTPTGTKSSAEWTFKDKQVTDQLTSTLGGRQLGVDFAGTGMAFKYNNAMKLQWAEIAGVDYTYGFDQNNQRTCAAYGINNPKGASNCTDLAGHFNYTYSAGRPVSTTDPQATLPTNASDAFTSLGNLKQLQDSLEKSTTTFGYDARQLLTSQVTKAEDPANDESLTSRRDATGRLLTQELTVVAPKESAEASPEPTEVVTPEAPSLTPQEPNESPVPTEESAIAEPSENASDSPVTETPGTGVEPTNRDAADAAGEPSIVETKFGYGSPNSHSAIVSYQGDGASVNITLPGGLELRGGLGQISSMAGAATLNFDATTGEVGTFAVLATGPNGENRSNNDGGPGYTLPGTATTEMGARTFHAEYGLFLQRDPSFSPMSAQYEYADGDPINYSDPSGNSREGMSKKGGLTWWQQTLISFSVDALGMVIGGVGARKLFTSRAWFKGLESEYKRAILYVYYQVVNTVVSVATGAAMTGGDLSKVSGITWCFDGIIGTMGGYMGAYSTELLNNAGDLMKKASTILDNLGKKLAAGIDRTVNRLEVLVENYKIFGEGIWQAVDEIKAKLPGQVTTYLGEQLKPIIDGASWVGNKYQAGKKVLRNIKKGTGAIFNMGRDMRQAAQLREERPQALQNLQSEAQRRLDAMVQKDQGLKDLIESQNPSQGSLINQEEQVMKKPSMWNPKNWFK